MKAKFTFLALVLCVLAGRSHAVTIDWVTVGDPGNEPDTEVMINDGTTGYGSVDYVYLIGKYEVTNSQYSEFLNAVAATDTYSLYNTNMGNSIYGGIERTGSPGSYSYSVRGLRANRPANYVSWYDTLRFCNWLNNGQSAGPQDNTTTEDGAYTFTDSMTVGNRNPGALVFLLTEDEWYKAAYYKGGGTDAGYWDYATQSDVLPISVWPEDDNGNAANYDHWEQPPYITEVGAYTQSVGPYGTFDQSGNMEEWNEGWVIEGYSRGLRDGAWNLDAYGLSSFSRNDDGFPNFESFGIGFRVTCVPEPVSGLFLCTGAIFLRKFRRF